MLTTVKGTYDHGQISLHEISRIQEGTEVLVPFLEQTSLTQRKGHGTDTTNKEGIRFGSLAGKVSIPADFNEPLDDLREYR
ncbi:hypothetical protein GGR92_003238 [Spirosoma lacussanchae]|uniref:DUF2281 domain-containing protein n=1 Tax=Spirosoma lacussanchae TaxID=1884249 RepID=UPI0011092EE4|nr:DUF2281 domain-containing protein [Spirosoma lacussanchae]